MANYRLFPSTNGPSTATSYSGDFIAGAVWTVTQNSWFGGYWWWVAASGQSTDPVKCALWSVCYDNENYQYLTTVIEGSVVTSGTLTAGQWNYIPLDTPIPVSIFDTLVAAIGLNGSFPDSVNWWTTNASEGITSGPLFAYGPSSQQGGTNYFSGGSGDPNSLPQGCYTTGGSDPSVTCPLDASSAGTDNFWVDIQITDVDPQIPGATYRLWPNRSGTDVMLGLDDNQAYVIGTEIDLSEDCTLKKIWFYSPPQATSLPTNVSVWSINAGGVTGTSVISNDSPAWTTTTGASATAGADWIYTTMPATNLPAGKYRCSVYNANGTSGGWSAKRLSYWGVESGDSSNTAVGINGITSGPLYAPPSTDAQLTYSYGNESNTEPGQSVFAVGPPNQYPNLYVGTGSPGGALFQNYWIDMEVAPSTGGGGITPANALLSMFP